MNGTKPATALNTDAGCPDMVSGKGQEFANAANFMA
jgi:hypothetical protein